MPDNEKELSKQKFSYDIQQNKYTEGGEQFNTEMQEDGYVFQFDRLYTVHQDNIKTYRFKAKLTPETLAKEQTSDSEVIGETDEKNAQFDWDSLDNEIWHIDTTIENYNTMVDSLWTNVYDENGNRVGEEEEKSANEEKGVQHYDAMDIILNNEEHHLPEDWTGKDKIYFITDAYPEMNLKATEDYPVLPDSTDNIINEAIKTIVTGLETLVKLDVDYDDVAKAGINPEEFGFTKDSNGKLIKSE